MLTDVVRVSKEIGEATREVFSTMIFMDVKSLEPLDAKGGPLDSHISSMLGLGGGIRGMLAVHCPEGVAKGITGGFLGMEVEELDEDVKDAIGEVANMVAGNLKVFFSDNGVDISLAIPTSIIGKSYRTRGLAGATRITVPFTMVDGTFWVELIYVVNR